MSLPIDKRSGFMIYWFCRVGQLQYRYRWTFIAAQHTPNAPPHTEGRFVLEGESKTFLAVGDKIITQEHIAGVDCSKIGTVKVYLVSGHIIKLDEAETPPFLDYLSGLTLDLDKRFEEKDDSKT